MIVRRPKLTFWDKLYLPQILQGMWITLKHIPKKKFTRQYPEEKTPLPARYRGLPELVRDADGRVKCVSCQLCEFVCPPKAIRIEPGPRPDGAADANVEKAPREFTIDALRCIYCGLCEEACPEQAIFLQRDFIACGYSREALRLRKEKLLELGGTHDDRIRKWKHK